jgi:CRP/FNR family transcriptional regulator
MASHFTYHEGHIIFDEEQAMDRVFIVLEGMIKLYHFLPDGQRQVTGFLGPGDILGGIKRKATAHCGAETITNVKLCGFNRIRFLQLLERQPNLCLSLLIAATDEIEAQHDHVTLLGRRRADERLAAFLLILGHRWPSDGYAEEVVALPMSRTDIADHLGQTIESVSRGLRKFKRLGYIELPKPSLVVLKNIPALCSLAGFEDRPVRNITLGV